MKTDESRAKKNEYVSYDSENPDFPLGFGNTEEEAIERGYDNVGDQNFDKSRIEVEKTENCVIENFPNKFELPS